MTTSVMGASVNAQEIQGRVSVIERAPETPAPAREGSPDVSTTMPSEGSGLEVWADATSAASPKAQEVPPDAGSEQGPVLSGPGLLQAMLSGARRGHLPRVEELRSGTDASHGSVSHPHKHDPASAPSTPPACGDADGSRKGTVNRQVGVPDPEPWAEPVDGNSVAEEILSILRRHVVLRPAEYVAVCLWCLVTYCWELFRVMGYLAVMSPTKRCGKSTLLSVLLGLVRRGLIVANPTTASLIRLPDGHKPTLLIDESDQEYGMDRRLVVVLNAAYTREAAHVTRVEGRETRQLGTYFPKTLACIGSLPPTLCDRSIVVTLLRRSGSEPIDELPRDTVAAFLDPRRRAARWVQDHLEEIEAYSVPALPGLNDRAADNWRPLRAVAGVLGPRWKAQAEEAAVSISLVADAESFDPRERLIRDIKKIFDAEDAARIEVARLQEKLVDLDWGFWSEFNRGGPLTKACLGRMLAAFGVRSRPIRDGESVKRYFTRADLEEVFARYCPHEGAFDKSQNDRKGH
jgi:hypothetical protein